MFGWIKRSPRKPAARPGRTHRLSLESLEDRLVPNAYTWTGNGGDDKWETPSNWDLNNGNVPGHLATDTATIDSHAYTVTLDTAETISSLTVKGATLKIGSGVVLEAQGSVLLGLDVNSVGSNLDLNDGGSLWIHSSSLTVDDTDIGYTTGHAPPGAVFVSGSATMTFKDTDTIATQILIGQTPTGTSTATLNIDSSVGVNIVSKNPYAEVDVSTGSTLNFQGNHGFTGDSATTRMSLVNNGTVVDTASDSVTNGNVDLKNYGTVNVYASSTLDFENAYVYGGSVIQYGGSHFGTDNGGVTEINGGTYYAYGASATTDYVDGKLSLVSGNLYVGYNYTNQAALNSITLNVSGDFTTSGGFFFLSYDVTAGSSSCSKIASSGTVYMNSSCNMQIDYFNAPGNPVGNAYTFVTGTINNAGGNWFITAPGHGFTISYTGSVHGTCVS